MAKITGPWLRGARKKLAGVVLQKGSRGGTIAREWVIPKNPQSQLQMAQRIIFATVTQAAKFLKPIVDHSFEGVEYGQTSVREFISLNLARLRELAAIDFAETPAAADAQMFTTTREVSALIPNKYIVSRGSLTKPSFTVFNTSSGLTVGARSGSLPARPKEGSTSLWVNFWDFLKAACNVEKGQVLSLVGVVQSGDGYRYTYNNDDAPGMQIPFTSAIASRIVFKESPLFFRVTENDGTTIRNNIADGILSDMRLGAVDLDKSDTVFMSLLANILASYTFTLSEVDGVKMLNFSRATNQGYRPQPAFGKYFFAATFVKSELVGNSWRRSDSEMAIAVPGTGSHNFGLLWAFTVDAWFKGYQVAEAEEFLDEGGNENQIG